MTKKFVNLSKINNIATFKDINYQYKNLIMLLARIFSNNNNKLYQYS